MHFGHDSHVHAHTDRSVLSCPCGWVSGEMSQQALTEFGLPWLCDDCGKRVFNILTFAPSERYVVSGMLDRLAERLRHPIAHATMVEFERSLRRDPYYPD